MNEYTHETLDAYYVEAASWNRDRVQSTRTSHRVAWAIAAAAALIAVLEAVALVLLTPHARRGAHPVLPRSICARARGVRYGDPQRGLP